MKNLYIIIINIYYIILLFLFHKKADDKMSCGAPIPLNLELQRTQGFIVCATALRKTSLDAGHKR